jgi:plastocyanin
VGLHSRAALGAAVAALVAAPGVAQAAQKTVHTGPPVKSQRAFEPYAANVNDFFPHRITIHAGDTVRFVSEPGFHTADIPARGQRAIPLALSNGKKVANAVDEAGVPFWFNGQDEIGFNPALLKFGFGKRFTYTGARRVQSGVPIVNRPKPMSVKFTRRGSFTYYCDVHPGMKGIVRVVSKRTRVPSAKADARTLKAQVAAALKVAKSLLASAKPAANTVLVGIDGAHGVHYFDFVPKTLSVPAGTTVRFAMPTRSTELHTATAGPGDPQKEPNSYLGKLTAAFESPVFDPRGIYPSDPPPAPGTLTAESHGNGFWNAGLLDGQPASPVPQASSVVFGAPGTYNIYCLIHPFMHGTITVT